VRFSDSKFNFKGFHQEFRMGAAVSVIGPKRPPLRQRIRTAAVSIERPFDPRAIRGGYFCLPKVFLKLIHDDCISGMGQLRLLLNLAAELGWDWPDDAKKLKSWTRPLPMKTLASRCGFDGKDRDRQLRTVIDDAEARGLIAIRPNGQQYEFALRPDNWENVPQYEATLKKPPAVEEESPPAVEQEAPRKFSTCRAFTLRASRPSSISVPSTVKHVELVSSLSMGAEHALDETATVLRILLKGEETVKNSGNALPESAAFATARNGSKGEQMVKNSGSVLPESNGHAIPSRARKLMELLAEPYRGWFSKVLDPSFAAEIDQALEGKDIQHFPAFATSEIERMVRARKPVYSGILLSLAAKYSPARRPAQEKPRQPIKTREERIAALRCILDEQAAGAETTADMQATLDGADAAELAEARALEAAAVDRFARTLLELENEARRLRRTDPVRYERVRAQIAGMRSHLTPPQRAAVERMGAAV
jgi:hypothetical protein